jgi:uncharacterized membrane protein
VSGLPVLAAGRLPAELTEAVATVPFAIAVLVIVVGLLRVVPSGRAGPAELAAALTLGLDFFLAAGLIRLSAADSFAALGRVAAIVVVRKVIGVGVRTAVTALLGMVPRLRA